MSRFTKSLSVFMTGMALVNSKTDAAQNNIKNPFESTLEPISLRPLNMPGDNLYAAHRSHSSHSSHRSSSGSYSSPKPSSPTPKNSYPRSNTYNSLSGSSQPVDPGRPAAVSPVQGDFNPNESKLLNLVMRVQIALLIKGYSPGRLDGVMGGETRAALIQFQKDNGIKADGLMSTSTLNALEVAAL